MGPKSKLASGTLSVTIPAMHGSPACLRTGRACGVAACLLITLFGNEAEAQESSAMSFSEMDKMSGVKGWNFGFPSFGDTLLQDYGGWRSGLSSVGIGVIEYNLTRFQANLLDTPREGPRFNPFYESRQNYWGQTPSFNN